MVGATADKIRVGIVNVTGYAGLEMARLILQHPRAALTQVTGRSAAGQRLADFFPHLQNTDLVIQEGIEGQVDVALLALPHKASAEITPGLLAGGCKVVDVSADFRLHDVATYEQWYKVTHPAPELLAEAIYGLPELHRAEIAKARLIASPGCYPTSAILGISPAFGLIEPDVIVDSKSGVSGSGRSLSLSNHYSEVNESVQAYGLAGHRHLPEMVQEMRGAAAAAGFADDAERLVVTFTPHLIPMTRGILSTIYAKLRQPITTAEVQERYRAYYAGHPFVRVVGQPPQTKQTWGSNYCLIHPTVDSRANRLVVVSCIDNLVKGAAGQVVQAMNLMMGFDETEGLTYLPIFP